MRSIHLFFWLFRCVFCRRRRRSVIKDFKGRDAVDLLDDIDGNLCQFPGFRADIKAVFLYKVDRV